MVPGSVVGAASGTGLGRRCVWAGRLGIDARTIQRRFALQTGMTFGQLRQQARLSMALMAWFRRTRRTRASVAPLDIYQ